MKLLSLPLARGRGHLQHSHSHSSFVNSVLSIVGGVTYTERCACTQTRTRVPRLSKPPHPNRALKIGGDSAKHVWHVSLTSIEERVSGVAPPPLSLILGEECSTSRAGCDGLLAVAVAHAVAARCASPLLTAPSVLPGFALLDKRRRCLDGACHPRSGG